MKPLHILPLLALVVPATTLSAQQDFHSLSETMNVLGSGYTVRSRDLDHGGGDWTASRPDGHAPIGVMGDHIHKQGEWMFSIRAMRMHMDGMRDNTNRLSSAQVLAQGFMVTPLEMDMDMLMFGAMYAASDEWTMTAMIPYLSNSMDHVTGGGARFTTESEGLGDLRLGGLYSAYDEGIHRVHLNVAVSLPTGSTDERDDTPAMANAKLPYPMQLGTGTYDLLPGLTYLAQQDALSWGAQVIPRFHFGENDESYRRGYRVDATSWIARRSGQFSYSFRINYAHSENIHGADPDLNPNMVSTADPDRQGGDRVDALVGLNYHFSGGALSGNRIALEFGVPVYQHLDGPQLEVDWITSLGWQYSL